MNKNKLLKRVRLGITIAVSLIVIAVLLHLTMNYLIPFIVGMHHNGGAY